MRRPSPTVVLAGVAGVLYNAWLLGFALDPAALRGSYVSALEAPGRPYAHLFVACDIVTGGGAVAAGLLLRRRRELAGDGLLVFGIGNILAATIPITARCATGVAACGPGVGQTLSPHDMASLVSVLGLLSSLLAMRRTRWMRAVVALWVLTGLFMVFSIVTDLLVITAQSAFLGACGVSLLAVPLAAEERR